MINKNEKVELNENSPILIYTNEVRNRLNFKIKTGYKLELLIKENQILLGDGPLIDKDKKRKNVPQLDQAEYVLLHYNLVSNQYLQNSKLLYEFVPNKSFGQLTSVKPPVFIQCKASDTILIPSKFGYIRITNLYKLKIRCLLPLLFKIIDFDLLNL